jgi:hypothetical protein
VGYAAPRRRAGLGAWGAVMGRSRLGHMRGRVQVGREGGRWGRLDFWGRKGKEKRKKEKEKKVLGFLLIVALFLFFSS